MGLKTISLAALTCALALGGAARSVEAQETVFLTAVRDLTIASGGVEFVRDRMAVALAEWDREINTLEGQFGQTAKSPERAFQLHVELGLTYRRRGRLDQALRHFDDATALQSGASDVHVLRALTFEAGANTVEAGRAFRAAWVRDKASPVKAYLWLRRTRDTETADVESARDVLRDAYRRILSGDHRSPEPPFLTLDLVPDASSPTPIAGDEKRARVFARLAAGKLDEAVAALKAGDPAAGSDDSALAQIARGRTAEREGRLSDARREYAAALEGTLAGRNALYVGIARLAQVEGELDAAIDAFGHAVALSPNDPALRRELAAALVAADRFEDAFAELVAALLIAPDDADLLAAVGQLFLDTNRAAEAIAPLRRALVVKADRYQTHYALAVALSRSGRTEDAAREFEHFERLSRRALDDRRRDVAGQPGLNEANR